VRNVIAVIGHGPALGWEPVAGAPLEVVVVTHLPASDAEVARVVAAIGRCARGVRVAARALDAHRARWLRPGVFQQSLVASGTTLWGDDAVLAAVPRWPATEIDRRESLDEQERAERELAAGCGPLARWRAVGALLIAKRSFVFLVAARAGALRTAWPEIQDEATAPDAHVVERARRLIDDWLFTWEGAGASSRARERYTAGWHAARAAGAGLG
jgi:hypothetical protein